MSFSRTDRSRLAQWWFTVDHVLIAALLTLVGVGLVLSLAASPAVAVKKGLPAFHFVERHAVFTVVGVGLMFAISLLERRDVRRLSLVLLAVSLTILVLLRGRWLEQP